MSIDFTNTKLYLGLVEKLIRKLLILSLRFYLSGWALQLSCLYGSTFRAEHSNFPVYQSGQTFNNELASTCFQNSLHFIWWYRYRIQQYIYKKTVYSYNIPHLFVYSEANDTGLGSISIDICTKSFSFM